MKPSSIGILVALLYLSCSSKPKVIQPKSVDAEPAAVVVEDPKERIHKVVVEDFLHASRYTYLNVSEDGETFWIAVPRSEVEKGNTYYYQGGVRMYNFKSEEHNRVFETLYLVGGLSEMPTGGGYAGGQTEIDMHGGKEVAPQDIAPIEGGVTLSELFKNVEQYGNQLVTVKGQCVKVNRNIMGKNWIHIQDGGKDPSNNQLDLTITTQEDVAIGAVAVFEGTIVLNKDFGSGYRYDIIMEEAKLKY